MNTNNTVLGIDWVEIVDRSTVGNAKAKSNEQKRK